MTMRSSVVLLLAVIYVYSRPLAAYADVRRYVLCVFLAAIFPQTINRPNFFLSIQHRWHRRTYFFNHYNVLFLIHFHSSNITCSLGYVCLLQLVILQVCTLQILFPPLILQHLLTMINDYRRLTAKYRGAKMLRVRNAHA